MSSFQPRFACPSTPCGCASGRAGATRTPRWSGWAARVVVLSTPGKHGMAEELASDIGAPDTGVVPLAEMHIPVAVRETAIKWRADSRRRLQSSTVRSCRQPLRWPQQ